MMDKDTHLFEALTNKGLFTKGSFYTGYIKDDTQYCVCGEDKYYYIVPYEDFKIVEEER